MAVKQSKRQKRNQPLRIVNPQSSTQIARVQARQSIILVLDPPTERGYASNLRYEVSLDSEYLKLMPAQSRAKKKSQRCYEVQQMFDLTSWTMLGRTFLGNVRISLIEDAHAEDDEQVLAKQNLGEIAVYLEPSPEAPQNKLVVFRPTQSQRLRLEGDEILEVILTDSPKMTWNPIVMSMESSNRFYLEMIHNTYLPAATKYSGTKGYECVHRVFDDFPNVVGQHHFFFRWSERSRAEAKHEIKGTHPGSRLTMIGKDISGASVQDRALKIYYQNRKTAPVIVEDKTCIVHVDLNSRTYNENSRFIANPDPNEQIKMSGLGDEWVVELMCPSPPDGSSEPIRWDVIVHEQEYESVSGQGFKVQRVRVSPKEDISVGTFKCQRFAISPMNLGHENADGLVLGDVEFHCPKLPAMTHKTIRCILQKSLITSAKSLPAIGYYPSGNSTSPYRSASAATNHTTSATTHHSHDKKKKALAYSEVIIEDVAFNDDLAAGETVKYGGAKSSKSSNDCYDTCDLPHMSKKKSHVERNGDSSSNGSNGSGRTATTTPIGPKTREEAERQEKSNASRETNRKETSFLVGGEINIELDGGRNREIVISANTNYRLTVPRKGEGIWQHRFSRTKPGMNLHLACGWFDTDSQKFNLSVTCDSTLEPGKYFVGTCLLTHQKTRETMMVLVFVRIEKERPKTPLSPFLTPSISSAEYMDGNVEEGVITLSNPLGRTRDVSLKPGEQLAIHLTHQGNVKEFTIRPMMQSGVCDCIQNQLFPTEKEIKQRLLFRFHGYRVAGDLAIMDGTVEVGRIAVSSNELFAISMIEEDRSSTVFANQGQIVSQLRDQQAVYLDPNYKTSIRLPKLASSLNTFLARSLKEKINVRFSQWSLSKDVVGELGSSLQEAINAYQPWEDFDAIVDGGLENTSDFAIFFDALANVQPYYNEIIHAHESVCNKQLPSIPLGTLHVTSSVHENFRMVREYPFYLINKEFGQTVLKLGVFDVTKTEPKDGDEIRLSHSSCLGVQLLPKHEKNRSQTLMFPWELEAATPWIVPMGAKMTDAGYQCFLFYVNPTVSRSTCPAGIIEFRTTSGLIKRLKVVVPDLTRATA